MVACRGRKHDHEAIRITFQRLLCAVQMVPKEIRRRVERVRQSGLEARVDTGQPQDPRTRLPIDVDPFAHVPSSVRNREWGHMVNEHVISMPDKWEYPWYAAWDLAFQCISMRLPLS